MSRSRRLGVAAALVGGDLVEGDVEIVDGRIAAVGCSSPRGHGVAVPGFVDLQVNGCVGIDLLDCDVDAVRTVSAALARTGTTAWLPTLPTATAERTHAALHTLAAATRDDHPGARPLGVHLEGPFLSPQRPGAHPVDAIRAVDAALLERYCSEAPVRMVTIAPELPGALALIETLTAAGVVVSLGHTDATATVAHQAFDRGATAHTHVWNAHRPMTSRDPGPAAVALTRSDVAPCLIADLVHSAAESLLVAVLAAADRYIVVSDASWPAGLPSGDHDRGGATLRVDGGAVRLADGTLAGSATLLDAAVRNLVALGRPVAEVVGAVSERPARLLGVETDHGDLGPGRRADVVVLGDDLDVDLVLVGGQSVE